LPVDLWKWRLDAMRTQVQALIDEGRVDVCIAEFLVSAPNIPCSRRVPLVLFEHNVEHVIWRRLAEL
jgi:hypothetical protein